MRSAIRVKSAKARAAIAIGLIRTTKPWPQGYGLERSFSACFEMGDGDEVYRLVMDRAARDPELRAAMHRHGGALVGLDELEQRIGAGQP